MSAVAQLLTSEVDEGSEPQPEDLALWSVTSIISCVGGNDGLINWSATETARAAVDNADKLSELVDTMGADEVRKWLARQRYAPPPGKHYTNAGLGTAFHAAAHLYTLTGARPQLGEVVGYDGRAGELVVDEDVELLLVQYDSFLDTYQPEFTAAEACVFNKTWGYAGQADAWAVLGGVDCLIDFKTHRDRDKPWHDAALQLAAYRNAERLALRMRRFNDSFSRRYYLLDRSVEETSVPVPHTDTTVVLSLTPRRWSLWKVDSGPEVFEHFGYAMEAARWTYSLSSAVLEKLDERKG